MPIDYSEYHPLWHQISKLVRAEANNRCEECSLLNHSFVKREGKIKPTKIILTVAHMDHDKTNNRRSNLKALCQKCHLGHDIQQHVANRKYGRKHNGPHQIKLF